MANEQKAALLDEDGTVVNVLVIDDDTPDSFFDSIIANQGHFGHVKSFERLTAKNPTEVSIGWKRSASGKYTEPPPTTIEPVENDVVSSVVDDSRLNAFSSDQKAILEEVLTDYVGSPVPPDTPTPTTP